MNDKNSKMSMAFYGHKMSNQTPQHGIGTVDTFRYQLGYTKNRFCIERFRLLTSVSRCLLVKVKSTLMPKNDRRRRRTSPDAKVEEFLLPFNNVKAHVILQNLHTVLQKSLKNGAFEFQAKE